MWVSFWESYLSISIYHLTGFFFQSTNELRWRFFVYCPSHSTYLNYFFEQTKRETTCEIKARHSHHSPKKKMFGFCFGFFWDGRAFLVFCVSMKFPYECCGHWTVNTHSLSLRWWCFHTSFAAAAAVVRLFWFSYLLTIYLSSVTLHKWHGKKI